MIPYGKQSVSEEDIKAVAAVLRSDWLTTGPKVEEFEKAICEYTGASEGVSVSSGTAALHTAVHAAGIGKGDEVIVPPMTFAATANAVLYQGGRPVFVDVDPDTLLIDVAKVEQKINDKTKAIISVDYAGQPCDYDALRRLAVDHHLVFISDACHALGAEYEGEKVGKQADISAFSFHPVKHITTGEGGMVLTNRHDLAEKSRLFRNHGINRTLRERASNETWYYEMVDLGFNYRLSDIQCALGICQLKRLPAGLKRRREVAGAYNDAFSQQELVKPLGIVPYGVHAYHLYVVKVNTMMTTRAKLFASLRSQGIGVNVHYIPVHLHPYYREHLGTSEGMCPVAERAYEQIISLPMYATLTDDEIHSVVEAVRKAGS